MKIRIYRGANSNVLPAIIFFHGGAFSVGGFRSHEALVTTLAKQLSCAVVVADYRLAPENSYPSAADDAYATIEWTAANAKSLGIDAERLILSGDSAGGTIAAVAARWLRDRRGPKVALQLLLYPMTDASLSSDSWQQFPNGPALNRGIIEAAWSRYSPNLAQRLSPDVSPLYASDLSALPPAIIVTADRDPLRDEGIAYGNALKSQRVEVTQLHYPGTVHAFLQVPGSEHGSKAVQDITGIVRTVFSKETPLVSALHR